MTATAGLNATADSAHTRWPFDSELVGNPEVPAVHGGIISALGGLTGATPFVGSLGRYTPTVDLRVDYLSHAGRGTSKGSRRCGAAGGHSAS